MTSNKNESPNMNPNNELLPPTPKVFPIAPIVTWVGSSIGGWILGEGLNFLKGLIFPGSSPLTMEQILAEVEKLLNQRLAEERKKILTAEYKGFNDLADRFLAATKAIASHEKNESIEIEEARATARELFVALDILMTQRLPQFEIEGYEGVSLPLFAEMCTLHLTLLKDGVLMGARWGLTSDDVKYYRNEFYRLTSDYKTRAVALYNKGFRTGDFKNLTVYKNTMNQYAMDLVYLWSLMRYEGITPSFSRSLWHYEGGTNPKNASEWKAQYKLMSGVPNSLLESATFNYTDLNPIYPLPKFSLYGVWPKYKLNKNLTGWMGSSGGMVSQKITYESPQSNPPKNAVIEYNSSFGFWKIKIGDTVVLPNDTITGNNIAYDGYYIRTISAIPKISFPANLDFSLGSKLELDRNPNPYDYVGNIILGFAPDNTKEFFKTGEHTLPPKGSYTIPALQYNQLNNASKAFLVEYLEQGTDGGFLLTGTADTNVIQYNINMHNVDQNKKYVLFLRIAGRGTITARIKNASQQSHIPSKTIGEFNNPNLYGWTDYVSTGFTFKLDDIGFPLPPVGLVLRKINDAEMRISQIMIIPESDFKILVP